MKTRFCLSVVCLGCAALLPAASPNPAKMLATAPLRFEPAADAAPGRFLARGARFRFSFTGNRADFRAGGESISMRFAGADPRARLEGRAPLRSTTAVYTGSDRSHWRTGIPNYARVQARDLYRGIDLVYYGNAGELEYDLTVKPGADPRQIRLQFDGGNAHLNETGDLVVGVTQKKPVAYQISSAGERIAIASRYRRNADGSYSFVLGRYDRSRELVIDPVLTFSSYLSGSSQDVALAIGHDSTGFLYIAGATFSTDLPMVGTSQQGTLAGNQDIFLAKLDPNAAPGTEVVYSTYLGGANNETVGGMVVGPNGDVYMTGTTASGDFPTANPAYGAIANASTTDAFVVWFDPSQTLVYSTYLGGGADDAGEGIAVDSRGRIWVTGSTQSNDFPNLNAYATTRAGQDAFVTGFDPSQSGLGTLMYSTYLGGTGSESGRGIAVAADGTVWAVGVTFSYDFPVTPNCFQPSYQTGGDAYVAHIDPTAGTSGLVYATYLGGTSEDEAKNVVLDNAGRVIISGFTLSGDFPVSLDAFQYFYGGNTDAFISILNPNASGPGFFQLFYSTFFGGPQGDAPFDLKRDAAGNLYLAGFTTSKGLPASANALQATYDNTMDAFALILNPARAGGAGLVYFTYLGSAGLQVGYGIDFDQRGFVYLVGSTSGRIFDKLNGAGKPSDPGNVDGFVIGFDPKGSQ